jgi:hypothetical protein
MFARVGRTLDKNVIICLVIAVGVLLLAGFMLVVTGPQAKAQPAPRTHAPSLRPAVAAAR